MPWRTPTVLVLEDDLNQHPLYLDNLSDYELFMFSEVNSFHEHLREINQPLGKLALLDLGLKEGFLWDFVDSSLLAMPFMIVSGSHDLTTLRDCYSRGAVDYLLKPIRPPELVAKIENFFNKQRFHSAGATLNHVVLDTSNMTLRTQSSTGVSLTPKEMRIVALLLKETSNGVPKTALFDHVWGSDHVKVNPKTLDIHMYNLRRKIRSAGLDIEIDDLGHYRLLSTTML